MELPVQLLQRAAQNIARSVGQPPSRRVELLYSPVTAQIAYTVAAELRRGGLQVDELLATAGDTAAEEEVGRRLMQIDQCGHVLLLDPFFAPAVFTNLGRPDTGILRPKDHLFCDWFIRPGGLVRTYGVDAAEQDRFRHWLRSRLGGAKSLRITTSLGTDITLVPRTWNTCWGEVYTTPVELIAHGRIVVDGSLYFEPPRRPFTLEIRRGRIVNLDQLDRSDRPQQMLYDDLFSDEGATVLAELGIGVNLGADRRSDIMEAEQARGTCHFGFGNNLAYGGENSSSYHGDLCVLDPTIEVDGRALCRCGHYFDYRS